MTRADVVGESPSIMMIRRNPALLKGLIAMKFRFSFEFQISKEMTGSLIAIIASALLETLLKLLLGL